MVRRQEKGLGRCIRMPASNLQNGFLSWEVLLDPRLQQFVSAFVLLSSCQDRDFLRQKSALLATCLPVQDLTIIMMISAHIRFKFDINVGHACPDEWVGSFHRVHRELPASLSLEFKKLNCKSHCCYWPTSGLPDQECTLLPCNITLLIPRHSYILP